MSSTIRLVHSFRSTSISIIGRSWVARGSSHFGIGISHFHLKNVGISFFCQASDMRSYAIRVMESGHWRTRS